VICFGLFFDEENCGKRMSFGSRNQAWSLTVESIFVINISYFLYKQTNQSPVSLHQDD
jgi:hypothetical protein